MTAGAARASEAAGRAFSTAIEDGVAVLTLDLPGEPVNTFTALVREEFASLLDALESDASVRAAVLLSGKPDAFIAGADIEEFLRLRSAEEAEALSRSGHRLLARVEQSRVPVVVAIHGACLGGGLEAALACAYRIATDDPKTVLALPEVQLGLIPGAGGTQRLPRTVGLRNALDMILTGKNVRARKALQIGLVHEIVHPAVLRSVAMERARALAEGRLPRRKSRGRHGAADLVLEDNAIGRGVVFRQAREQTLAKTHGHYPAPLAAIEAIAAGYSEGRERGYATEARLFGRMAATDVSRQLIFLFFASNALKKDPGVEPPAPAAHPVEKIGVLGAGFMGAGIASVAAMQGTLVRLKDADLARVGAGLRAVQGVLREQLKKRRITQRELADEMLLASGTAEYTGFGNVDLVVEAVFEDVGVKHRVLEEAEAVIPARAVYATNTSSIPIARIAQAARHPERVIGMHFFSPVHRMPLLEVIPAAGTNAEAVVTAVAYGKRLGKTVIVVRDAPGFYVNRILSPYVNEAGRLLDEGVPIEALDRALVEFGFPVGPITLLDEVGLDVAAKAGGVMHEAFGARMEPSQSLQRVIAAGRTGRKGRKGFYLYDAAGKKGSVDQSVYELLDGVPRRHDLSAAELQQRVVLPLVNEAARCLEEGIIRSPRDGDIGAVFGIGFPPFRGGPFRYMDSPGIGAVVRQLEMLDERFPGRYTPAGLLKRMADAGERFYPVSGDPLGG